MLMRVTPIGSIQAIQSSYVAIRVCSASTTTMAMRTVTTGLASVPCLLPDFYMTGILGIRFRGVIVYGHYRVITYKRSVIPSLSGKEKTGI